MLEIWFITNYVTNTTAEEKPASHTPGPSPNTVFLVLYGIGILKCFGRVLNSMTPSFSYLSTFSSC